MRDAVGWRMSRISKLPPRGSFSVSVFRHEILGDVQSLRSWNVFKKQIKTRLQVGWPSHPQKDPNGTPSDQPNHPIFNAKRLPAAAMAP